MESETSTWNKLMGEMATKVPNKVLARGAGSTGGTLLLGKADYDGETYARHGRKYAGGDEKYYDFHRCCLFSETQEGCGGGG